VPIKNSNPPKSIISASGAPVQELIRKKQLIVQKQVLLVNQVQVYF
jgi:hypothetical protein